MTRAVGFSPKGNVDVWESLCYCNTGLLGHVGSIFSGVLVRVPGAGSGIWGHKGTERPVWG